MSNIGLYKEDEIINKTIEIAKSLCEEFPGLTMCVRNCDDRRSGDYVLPYKYQGLEITFVYIPLMIDINSPHIFNHRHGVFTVYPHDIVDLDVFEKVFRKAVIKEVINDKDRFERTYKEGY